MREKLITSLITAIVITGINAQNVPAVPKLVIGLTIDQLRTDYIEAFSSMYGVTEVEDIVFIVTESFTLSRSDLYW